MSKLIVRALRPILPLVVSPSEWWRVYTTATAGSWNEVGIAELAFMGATGAILTDPADALARAFASSTSSHAGLTADKAFDRNANTFWASATAASGVGVGQNAWIGWRFASAPTITQIAITAGPNYQESPMNFTVQKSTDSSDGTDGTWTTVKTVVNDAAWVNGQTKVYVL